MDLSQIGRRSVVVDVGEALLGEHLLLEPQGRASVPLQNLLRVELRIQVAQLRHLADRSVKLDHARADHDRAQSLVLSGGRALDGEAFLVVAGGGDVALDLGEQFYFFRFFAEHLGIEVASCSARARANRRMWRQLEAVLFNHERLYVLVVALLLLLHGHAHLVLQDLLRQGT